MLPWRFRRETHISHDDDQIFSKSMRTQLWLLLWGLVQGTATVPIVLMTYQRPHGVQQTLQRIHELAGTRHPVVVAQSCSDCESSAVRETSGVIAEQRELAPDWTIVHQLTPNRQDLKAGSREFGSKVESVRNLLQGLRAAFQERWMDPSGRKYPNVEAAIVVEDDVRISCDAFQWLGFAQSSMGDGLEFATASWLLRPGFFSGASDATEPSQAYLDAQWEAWKNGAHPMDVVTSTVVMGDPRCVT